MSYAETVLPEFDQEMASTLKVLERIPDDKFDWQPHPRSHTIGWNANHIADIPKWVVMVLNTPSLDIAPSAAIRSTSPKPTTRAEILDVFDRNVAAARKAITEAKDVDTPLDAVAGRQSDFHDAALGCDPLNGPQPLDTPSRPSHRLPPFERRPSTRHVRTIGR